MKRQLVPNPVLRIFDRFMREYDDYRVRRLKRHLKHCGNNVSISPHCIILSGGCIELGNDVCINAFTHIFGGGGVVIDDGAMISSNCSITSVTHIKNSQDRLHAPCQTDTEHTLRPVKIGRNAWLGTGAIILPGVTIGEHAIVGAGAVVTKDVPDKCVYVGNPAKFIERLSI